MQQQDTGIAKLLSAENEAKEIIEKAKSGSLHTNLLYSLIKFIFHLHLYLLKIIFFFNHPQKKTERNDLQRQMKAEAEQEIKEFKEKKEKEFAAMKEDVKLESFSLFQ